MNWGKQKGDKKHYKPKTKRETFVDAVMKFKHSTQTNKDYFQFIVVAASCFNQGGGLTWSEADKLLIEALGGESAIQHDFKQQQEEL